MIILNQKLNKLMIETFNIKLIDNTYNKINIVRQFEIKFNIAPLDINYNMANKIELPNDYWELVKKIFRCTKPKPVNMVQFKIIYIGFIRNICGNDIIKSKQIRIGKGFERIYNLNLDLIHEHINLNQFVNPSTDNFKAEYIEMFKIKPNLELLEQSQKMKINNKYQLLNFDVDDE